MSTSINTDLDSGPVFFETYSDCRAAFLTTARSIGALVNSYAHPSESGAQGEELAIDVALAGPPDAKRLLVFCSGIHGCEGFAGAALQLDTMRNLGSLSADGEDVACLFIHGLNPFGWSHRSRTNENQVDLNRNFLEFPQYPAEHTLAAEIQQVSLLSTAEGPDFHEIMAGMNALIAQHGFASVSDAVQCGQYFQKDGVGYGGNHAEWSNVTLRRIWAEYFPRRELIGVIDWHTGIGEHGEPVVLCFDEPGSTERATAAFWWGTKAVDKADSSYESGDRPNYSGLHLVAAQEAARAHGAVAVGAVIEFGTFEAMEAASCLWIDRWLRNLPADADTDTVNELRKRTLRFFCPNDAGWKDKVLTNGRKIVRQAFTGTRRPG